uniref:TolB family protein n=1 Tax=Roseivirga sp. TaxID=1964215 RepID=UPI004047A1A9
MKSTLRATTLVVILALASYYTFAQDAPTQTDSTKTDKKKKKDLPLEAGRTFKFDLTEGSWIALDVSPDGKTVVFDFLGDLYTIPITGGDATQITEGMQFDSQPRFSPNGKKVIFISDESGGENVWTYDFDTQKKNQVTKGNSNNYQSPEWTPDGKYMIASKQSSAFCFFIHQVIVSSVSRNSFL